MEATETSKDEHVLESMAEKVVVGVEGRRQIHSFQAAVLSSMRFLCTNSANGDSKTFANSVPLSTNNGAAGFSVGVGFAAGAAVGAVGFAVGGIGIAVGFAVGFAVGSIAVGGIAGIAVGDKRGGGERLRDSASVRVRISRAQEEEVETLRQKKRCRKKSSKTTEETNERKKETFFSAQISYPDPNILEVGHLRKKGRSRYVFSPFLPT